MTTMAEARALDARDPVVMLVLYLDYCTLNYGVGACTASGGQCRYTWETCEDTANYDKGEREYKFTNRGAFYQSGALPYLRLKFKSSPTEILPDRFQTERGRMVFELDEDDAHPTSDPTKTAKPSDSGRFWRNLLARNPNYPGRKVELYEGFEEVDIANWDLAWAGYIEDIDFIDGGVSITCVDRLWFAAEAKAPGAVSDTNTVQQNPMVVGASVVEVVDTDEFPDATANEPQVLKIEDEYIIYTGKFGIQLTGCTRGAFGTTAAEHAYGTAISNVLIYANDDGATWATCTGLSADHILCDLLCNRAGISADHLAVVDREITLNEALDDSETDIDLNNANQLPYPCVVRVGSDDGAELILVLTADADGITSCKRGMFGTTAAAANDDTPVYLVSLARELQRWRPSTLWACRYDSEIDVEEIIEELRQSVGFDVWQNEQGLIDTSIQSPVLAFETVTELTHEDMLPRSRKHRRNEESRCTAVVVRYAPSVPDAGDSKENYAGVSIYVGAEEENANSYGKRKVKTIYAPFCTNATDTYWLAVRNMNKYRQGMPLIDYAIELKDADLSTGDPVYLTFPERVDVDGTVIRRLYTVTRRERKGLNEIWLRAADTGFGDDRFGLIAPALSTLDANISDSDTSLDVALDTNRSISDYRADGGTIFLNDEEIDYETVNDQGGGVIRLGSLTRGANGTTPAAHTAGDLIVMAYDGASDQYRDRYVFNGSDSDAAGTQPEYKMA